jgi:hypothetical protein
VPACTDRRWGALDCNEGHRPARTVRTSLGEAASHRGPGQCNWPPAVPCRQTGRSCPRTPAKCTGGLWRSVPPCRAVPWGSGAPASTLAVFDLFKGLGASPLGKCACIPGPLEHIEGRQPNTLAVLAGLAAKTVAACFAGSGNSSRRFVCVHVWVLPPRYAHQVHRNRTETCTESCTETASQMHGPGRGH